MTGAFVVVCCFLGFVVLGATQSLYGPAVPAFLRDFHVSDQVASYALAAHFIGGSLGVLLYARLRRSVGVRVLVATSYATMAVGALGFAASPSWAACIAAALVLGLGFGGIDYGLNGLAAADKSPRGTALLNVLNACFGAGAIGGPWLLSALGDGSYRVAFGGCAAVAPALALATVARSPASPLSRSARESASQPAPSPRPPSRGTFIVVAGFIAFYVIHVGIEVGVGGWEPTHLIRIGYSATSADQATAAFWFAMTAGRLLVVPLVRHVPPRLLVTGCFAGMTAALLTATVAPLAPASYVVVGLFIAPIFPTGLPWLLDVAPGVSGAMAWVFAASMLGGVIVPPALGAAIALIGAPWLPVCLAALSAAGLLVCVALILAGTASTRSGLAT